MNITNAASIYNTANFFQVPLQGQTSGPATATTQDQVTLTSDANQRFSAAKEIMKQYDLHNISQNELTSMAEKLFKNELVSERDYAHLTKPRADFSQITGQSEPISNEKRDYIGYYQEKIAFQNATGSDEKSIRFNEHMLSLLTGLDSFSRIDEGTHAHHGAA